MEYSTGARAPRSLGAFETSARIVFEDAAPECQIGKRHWSHYVSGWDVWPIGSTADIAGSVDWAQYDVVISVDVAVPTRIIRRFPQVMWCYYFIEGGPAGIATRTGPCTPITCSEPRLAKPLVARSRSVRPMTRTRRAVLDFLLHAFGRSVQVSIRN